MNRATNKYCDVLLMEWMNQDSFTSAQRCSSCILESTKLQLNSPFGYHEEFAEDFASMTASCKSTGYAVTSPAPYPTAVGTTTATTTGSLPVATDDGPLLSSSCVTLYKTKRSDTCNSIATSQNVSTYAGMISIHCSSFLRFSYKRVDIFVIPLCLHL